MSVSIITILLTAVKTFFSWLIGKRKAAEKKEKEEAVKAAESELENAIDKGNLADLIDATNKLGKAHKK